MSNRGIYAPKDLIQRVVCNKCSPNHSLSLSLFTHNPSSVKPFLEDPRFEKDQMDENFEGAADRQRRLQRQGTQSWHQPLVKRLRSAQQTAQAEILSGDDAQDFISTWDKRWPSIDARSQMPSRRGSIEVSLDLVGTQRLALEVAQHLREREYTARTMAMM